MVRSHVILGFASAHGEIVGLRSKAADPAASTNGFPKASRPLAAGGCLSLYTRSTSGSAAITPCQSLAVVSALTTTGSGSAKISFRSASPGSFGA